MSPVLEQLAVQPLGDRAGPAPSPSSADRDEAARRAGRRCRTPLPASTACRSTGGRGPRRRSRSGSRRRSRARRPLGDPPAGAADLDGELGLGVDVGRLRRQHDRLAGPDQRVRELAEEERLGRRLEPLLADVRGVVEPGADDLHSPYLRGRLRAMAIGFGVTVLPDPPYTRFLELLELAERHGLRRTAGPTTRTSSGRSRSRCSRSRPTATSTMKLGHFVTNPGTREPTVLASAYATLHDISGGRMVMGIGRGDSARRVHRPAAGEGGRVRGGLPDDPRLHERPRGRVERQGAAAHLGAQRAADPAAASPATARRRSPSPAASPTA